MTERLLAMVKEQDQALCARIERASANEQLWRQSWDSDHRWAVVRQEMTEHQSWLVSEFLAQATAAWTQMNRELEAQRIAEAKHCLNKYYDRFDKAAGLRNQIMVSYLAGQPTAHIGENIVPNGWKETVVFRDSQGRISRLLERPAE